MFIYGRKTLCLSPLPSIATSVLKMKRVYFPETLVEVNFCKSQLGLQLRAQGCSVRLMSTTHLQLLRRQGHAFRAHLTSYMSTRRHNLEQQHRHVLSLHAPHLSQRKCRSSTALPIQLKTMCENICREISDSHGAECEDSLWDMALCCLVEIDWRFKGAYCLFPVDGGSTHLWNVCLL
jgi:hypothetical protein